MFLYDRVCIWLELYYPILELLDADDLIFEPLIELLKSFINSVVVSVLDHHVSEFRLQNLVTHYIVLFFNHVNQVIRNILLKFLSTLQELLEHDRVFDAFHDFHLDLVKFVFQFLEKLGNFDSNRLGYYRRLYGGE